MTRPFKDEPFEALERRLIEARTDSQRLIALLHELSFRDGPREARLKERAEEARIQLLVAQKRDEMAMRGIGGATRDSADAAAAVRSATAAGSSYRDPHKDFPGFDPGPMLNEMTSLRGVLTAQDRWRRPNRHLAVLTVSICGILALAMAHLSGAFRATSTVAVREVAQLPYIAMGLSAESGVGELKPTSMAMNGAGAGPEPNRPGVLRPVGRINLTTDLANMYAGEGPQIARAAVAAAGLGLNETVRWRNEKSGRHGTVTLIAQNPQRTSCYTARITRLDTKSPQRRTQQLCF